MSVSAPPTTISVPLDEYFELLVEAGITDPARWPSGYEQGAALLARIREIEDACIAAHGGFDFDKLSRKEQDEYDHACIDLDELIDPDDDDPVSFEDFVASLEQVDE